MSDHVLNVVLATGAFFIWTGSFLWYFRSDLARWLDRQYWWHQRRWPWRR